MGKEYLDQTGSTKSFSSPFRIVLGILVPLVRDWQAIACEQIFYGMPNILYENVPSNGCLHQLLPPED